MTMQRNAQRHFPSTPLSSQRSGNTLRLRALMEEQQRIEIGQRIRGLREASPQTNASIADHVGVGERAVANWMSGKTGITYEHARKVAQLFDVDVRWLWDGKERQPSGDLMDALGSASQEASPAEGFERIEDQIASLRTELLAELSELRSAQEGRQSRRGRSARGREASGN